MLGIFSRFLEGDTLLRHSGKVIEIGSNDVKEELNAGFAYRMREDIRALKGGLG